MCLAIPGRIVEIKGDKNHAIIDYGQGTRRKANISLVDAKKGEYVIVHAGFAIQKIDKNEAERTLDLFKNMLNQEESEK
ncbi:MAG: HypC/HybG/HupF family hydrogenase formation chaperone [Candidatus Thermoplasmatota archaeon]